LDGNVYEVLAIFFLKDISPLKGCIFKLSGNLLKLVYPNVGKAADMVKRNLKELFV
jgi:hypothetical protein